MSTTPQTTSQTPEQEAPELSAAAPVSNKRIAASGVIPKRMQSWIFLTVLFVCAVGLWFSSGSIKAAKPSPGTAAATDQVKPAVAGLSPDEVQTRLKENEDASRNAAASPHSSPPETTDGHFNALFGDINKASNDAQNPPDNNSRDSLKEEERKREYQGRFASNIALSYRSDPHSAASGSQAQGAGIPATPGELPNVTAPQSAAPGLPADFQQQLDILQGQQQKLLAQAQQQLATATGVAAGSQPQPQAPGSPARGGFSRDGVEVQPQSVPTTARRNPDLNAAIGKQHVIFEGTVLESALVNRLNGDFAGPVICQISTDVYSHDHAELLIPAGSRILGETKKVNDVGQERLAVVFHRLIMPDGYAVDLDQAPGLNQIGETALHDQVNNHYFRIFGASIAIGAIAGLSTIGANNSTVTGLPTSNSSAYREGVAGSTSQSSLQILNRFLNVLPTITIREGHRVRIFLTQDLLLPAYSNHRMPSDL
ncbi:MAG TPA: TrbI/VirB10 family protein [Candidatus Angelobacter sp.]|nr:TrbI/VirB10 family protein [Candidatus Angelobacter sp.]